MVQRSAYDVLGVTQQCLGNVLVFGPRGRAAEWAADAELAALLRRAQGVSLRWVEQARQALARPRSQPPLHRAAL
ncbi:MAG: hypothetical protein F2796_05245 [Actinobacteria bacterium]|nr:hypothetical protein [Actinomycetota bacterium]